MRFEHGIWLGKQLDSDEHLIGTKDGVFSCRTVKRLSEYLQINKTILEEMVGVPWDRAAGRLIGRPRKQQPALMPGVPAVGAQPQPPADAAAPGTPGPAPGTPAPGTPAPGTPSAQRPAAGADAAMAPAAPATPKATTRQLSGLSGGDQSPGKKLRATSPTTKRRAGAAGLPDLESLERDAGSGSAAASASQTYPCDAKGSSASTFVTHSKKTSAGITATAPSSTPGVGGAPSR